ncbi:PDR/VanB family oxidoreductase [Piscinibacter koreensis]|uniref:Oxidoreductase n=1 Tax=Piscinibacter koreensis TaxID=2742824 RepID=A0A7Y6TWK7_9BURK|nr:PDR/VanB family oxidoreductase [Schlegelella koreensis]NUZ06137.1 oxidoreductase [Schlegelella koreensis]
MPDLLALRLRQIRLEADGVASYELVAADGRVLPPFTAGAHVDLHLPEQRVRSYSLVNDPAERHRYVIAVQLDRDGRGGSRWLHGVPRVGDVLQASSPINDFALDASDAPAVLVAGGIGITPIVSMLHRLVKLGRPWRLHYAARSREQAAFLDAVERLAGDAPSRVSLHLGAGDPRLDLRAVIAQAPPDAHLYCCGPARMIDEFVALAAGRAPTQVHVERFAAASEAATGGGFEVVLKKSGQRFLVEPGKTILDTLLDHEVEVQYSCSSGVCGTCRTPVLEGTPDHRDDYLSDDEKRANDSIMVCCSGSRSKTLVLDL